MIMSCICLYCKCRTVLVLPKLHHLLQVVSGSVVCHTIYSYTIYFLFKPCFVLDCQCVRPLNCLQYVHICVGQNQDIQCLGQFVFFKRTDEKSNQYFKQNFLVNKHFHFDWSGLLYDGSRMVCQVLKHWSLALNLIALRIWLAIQSDSHTVNLYYLHLYLTHLVW